MARKWGKFFTIADSFSTCFLLIWIDAQENIIKLTRLSSHSELFR